MHYHVMFSYQLGTMNLHYLFLAENTGLNKVWSMFFELVYVLCS